MTTWTSQNLEECMLDVVGQLVEQSPVLDVCPIEPSNEITFAGATEMKDLLCDEPRWQTQVCLQTQGVLQMDRMKGAREQLSQWTLLCYC